MRVTAILRTDRKDSGGLSKIVIRISDKTEKRYITTRFSVKPSQFKNGRVDKHPEAAKINLELARLISEIQSVQPKSSPNSFKDFAEKFIDKHQSAGTRVPGVIRYYRSQLNKFLRFAGENIRLVQLTPDLLSKYRSYMKSIGNAPAGMKSSEKFLKVIINHAVLVDALDKNPYDKLEPVKERKPVPTFLTANEVNKIEHHGFDKSNPLYRVSKWFLIQCYTGLRHGDLKSIDLRTIKKEKRVTIATSKTGAIVSREATPELIELMEQAGPFNISLEEYNRQLKSLASAVGISKRLTSHVGRHTLSMRWLELGKPLEALQGALGHSSIKTTQIYARIQGKTVNEAFSDFRY